MHTPNQQQHVPMATINECMSESRDTIVLEEAVVSKLRASSMLPNGNLDSQAINRILEERLSNLLASPSSESTS